MIIAVSKLKVNCNEKRFELILDFDKDASIPNEELERLNAMFLRMLCALPYEAKADDVKLELDRKIILYNFQNIPFSYLSIRIYDLHIVSKNVFLLSDSSYETSILTYKGGKLVQYIENINVGIDRLYFEYNRTGFSIEIARKYDNNIKKKVLVAFKCKAGDLDVIKIKNELKETLELLPHEASIEDLKLYSMMVLNGLTLEWTKFTLTCNDLNYRDKQLSSSTLSYVNGSLKKLEIKESLNGQDYYFIYNNEKACVNVGKSKNALNDNVPVNVSFLNCFYTKVQEMLNRLKEKS